MRCSACQRCLLPQYRYRTIFMWCLTALNLFANYGLFSWLPTLLVQNGWTLAGASRVTSFLAIGGLTGCYFVSTQADRGRTVMALMGVYLTGAIALGLCATNPGSTWMWAVLIILIGFGGIGASLTLAPLASTYYPPELRSTGVGWANGVGTRRLVLRAAGDGVAHEAVAVTHHGAGRADDSHGPVRGVRHPAAAWRFALATGMNSSLAMRVPKDHWYPLLESREVRRKPVGLERLGNEAGVLAQPRTARFTRKRTVARISARR